MMFFLRAAFWLAIVSVFVPRDFAGEAMDLPFDTARTQIDADAAVSDWCVEREALCQTGAEAVHFGGMIAEFAMVKIASALEENEANNPRRSRNS
ncbi:MAG: hypothetical protein ACI82N_000510 [Maricaulis sp.]|jgi:hypothetical protein